MTYFTIDPATGKRLAIKVARPSDWSHRRIKREIKIQTEPDHPNLLPVLAHDDDLKWYAAAQAECSLEELGPFPRPQWGYFRTGLLCVVSAVSYAHTRGYVHRDLSPGNVLVFAGGWAVADWGFVSAALQGYPRMTQPLERFGTPEFTSPEMVADPREVGPPADIFSIGRLAAWGTQLKRGQGGADEDAAVRWWRRLIDGTTAYEPAARWKMQDVETHLRSYPPLMHKPNEGDELRRSPEQATERCPLCGSGAGRDAAERCLGCHALVVY